MYIARKHKSANTSKSYDIVEAKRLSATMTALLVSGTIILVGSVLSILL